MSCAVTFVMVMATAVTHPVYTYLLDPNGLGYLDTITFILVIAAFVQLVEILLKKYIPALYKTLGVYLPLITTNCAILGVTLLNIQNQYDYLHALINALGAGPGLPCWRWCFSPGCASGSQATTCPRPLTACPSP